MRAIDVFLSYTRTDSAAVKCLADELRRRQLEVWLDESELPAGQPWIREVEEALKAARVVIVALGPSGIGDWAKREIYAALELQVKEGKSVIPVMLPSAQRPGERDLPLFLKGNTWVAFEQSVTEELPLDSLYFAITGKRFIPTFPPLPPPPDPTEDALDKLTRALASGAVTFFVGSGMSQARPDLPPRSYELADYLLEMLKYESRDPPFPRDVVGDYFSVWSGSEGQLEDSAQDFIRQRTRCAPLAHQHLAQLISRCAPAMRGRRRKVPQVIVTSNMDLLIERAFLRAGVPFTRLVPQPTTDVIHANVYANVEVDGPSSTRMLEGDEWRSIDHNDYDTLDQVIKDCGLTVFDPTEKFPGSTKEPLRLERMPQPILYKCHGSIDILDSCAISADLCMKIAATRNTPLAAVTAAIGNTPSVFLGYCLFDPELRLLYHTMLREAFQVTDRVTRYAIHQNPTSEAQDRSRRFEARLWPRVKEEWVSRLRSTVIEESCETFLERLVNRV